MPVLQLIYISKVCPMLVEIFETIISNSWSYVDSNCTDVPNGPNDIKSEREREKEREREI